MTTFDYLRKVAYSEGSKAGRELRPKASWVVCDIWSVTLERTDRLVHIVEMAMLDDPVAAYVMGSNE